MAERAKSSDHDPGLLAAAQAAASWARARRATWTSAPLEIVGAPDVTADDVDEETFEPAVETTPTAAAVESIPISAEASGDGQGRAVGSPLFRLLPYAAAIVALGGVAYVGWPYLSNALSTSTAEKAAAKPAANAPPTPATTEREGARGRGGAAGTLSIKSNPAAQVVIDGTARGTTPMTLTDLTVGKHEVLLKADVGSVRKTVEIAANETAEVEESIFSGFAAIYLPFDVTISENGKQLRPDDRNQIMLSAGVHDLRLTSRPLSYDVVRQVEVKPGETTTLRLAPTSPVTVTATETMEVWLDGTRVGSTPVNAMQVAVGVHEVLVKKSTGAERKYSITVGGNPVTLNADF